MKIWSYDHMIIRSYDHMIIWSHDHMIMWSYGHTIIWSYDDMIIWSSDHMIIWSYGHTSMIIWSYDHMIIWSYDHTVIWSWSYVLFFTIFGRTDLRISLSEAKFDAEADFDVRSAVAPQKPDQIDEKLIFRSKNFAENFFRCRKIKCCKSSETRFDKIWRLSGLCSRGKRPFKVWRRRPTASRFLSGSRF